MNSNLLSILKQESHKDVIVIKPPDDKKFERQAIGTQKSTLGISKSVTIDLSKTNPLKSIGSSVLNQRLEAKSSKNLNISELMSKQDNLIGQIDDKKSFKKKGRQQHLVFFC